MLHSLCSQQPYIIMPTSQMRAELREVNGLAQGHTVRKRRSQGLSPDPMLLEISETILGLVSRIHWDLS